MDPLAIVRRLVVIRALGLMGRWGPPRAAPRASARWRPTVTRHTARGACPLAAATALVLATAGPALAPLAQQAGQVDLLTQANLRMGGAAGFDFAGISVAGAGDQNGDGVDDVIVGATGSDSSGRMNSGAAYVLFGRSTPTTIDLAALGSAGFRIDGAAAGDDAGISVAGAGDLNGDGRDDLIVGADLAGNNGRASSGSAYVILGRAAPADIDLAALGTAGFRIDGAAAGAHAGSSVAGAGDVNGDGRDDVIVEADSPEPASVGADSADAAYVIFGQPAPTNIDLAGLGGAGFRIGGAGGRDLEGVSVDGAGDVNGDGRDDVVVGASLADANGRADSGSAYVIFGRAVPAGVDLAALGASGFRIDGAAAGDQAGIAVAGAGDLDGDGRGDVIVGADLAGDNDRAQSGSAYVILGRSAPTNIDLAALGTAGYRIDGAAAGDRAGYAVGGAGDLNGDGRDDLIVGAAGADNNGRASSGSAYVVFGRTAPASIDLAAIGPAGFRIDGAAAGDQSGVAVAGAGDLNGDGRDDAIVGARLAGDNGRIRSGSAYGILGFGEPSLAYAPLSGTVGAPVTHSPTGVRRTGPAAFSISPSLPPGLSLDPARGTVDGTPTAALATTTFTVTMSDLAGQASAPLSMRIAGGRRLTAAPVRCQGRLATIVGTPGRDVISGTTRADVIASGGGADLVRGGAGADVICLGPGDDRALGGPGGDRIDGQGGDDGLAGGPGADRLRGGPGRDALLGGAGRDLLLGGPGRDRAVEGAGADRCGSDRAGGC